MFKFIVDTFSVARDSDHFIQLKTLKKPGTEDQVWLAIEIVGDGKYARSTAQNIIDTMEEVFFENPEMGAYERFERALKEVNLILGNLKEKRGKAFGQINAIIAVFSGNELHLTQGNSAEAYLIRRNKLSMISEGLASRSGDLFVNIASGELLPDDKLVFSTVRLLRIATHSQMVNIFGDGVAEAIESMRELAMGNEDISVGVMAAHIKLVQRPVESSARKEGGKWWAGIKSVFAAFVHLVGEKSARRPEGKPSISKKKILLALAAVVAVLAISVSVLNESRRNKAIREEYQAKIESLNSDIVTANTRGLANDKETANRILDEAEESAQVILAADYFREEVMNLVDKIQETRDSVNNTERIKKMTPFIDLSAKKADVKALGLIGMDSNFFVHEYNRLYEIILDQVLDPRQIDDTEVVVNGTAMEDQSALVFITQSGRVIEYADGVFRFANTDDEVWKAGVAVAAYGKYIYLLSPKDNQIYKYSRLRNKYSSGSAYNDDTALDDAISLAIDGDIYVLKQGGTIVRIYKSKQQPFRIEGLGVDISEATRLYTSPELTNLYILDPKNNRVVMVAKNAAGNARYYGQIIFEGLDDIQDLYVQKDENKLFLLTSKAVYKIDI